ncbi:MAG TPA: BON domain-containing protein [Vicinamibacterales bacterium]|nr:BON domain-containing protein [Vicinamibacterales bacterium]
MDVKVPSFRWMLAVPLLAAATTAFAQTASTPAQEPRPEPRETARQTGNAITDSWITLKIHSQFIPDDALEGSDIDVDTNAGVVMLTGTVRTEAGKARAEAIAKATDGVKSVKNSLRIGPADSDAAEAGRRAGEETREATGTAGKAVTDGWIKSKIASQYITEDALDDSDIDIDVERGAVTLNGTVKTDAARSRAEALAKATDGVRSVRNNLKVGAK